MANSLNKINSGGIKDDSIVNADIKSDAAIAGTKIAPNFGSQNIVTTGTVGSGDLTITSTAPFVSFVDSDHDDDFNIQVSGGTFAINSTTDSATRLQIDSSGNVVVGATSANASDSCTLNTDGEFRGSGFYFTNNIGSPMSSDGIRRATTGTIAFDTGSAERLRIDSSGRILQGSTASRTIAVTAASPQLQLEGVGSNASSAAIICNQNAVAGPVISLGKTRGGSVGGTTVVQSGDHLGHITFEGSDGSAQRTAARIASYVDGTPGSSDMPGRLMFYTTPDGSASEVERLRIHSSGEVSIPAGITLGLQADDKTASNTLDDYEEGTHTAADASGQSISITNEHSANYVKIGQFVYLQVDITYGSTSNTSDARITVPFQTGILNYGGGACGWTDLGRPVFFHVSTSGCYLMDNNATGVGKYLLNSECSGKRFIGQIKYKTTA
tara:strand:- start:191 stop:1513 length:1323 start_codon:yes stop_codon:yes gene_type:complete